MTNFDQIKQIASHTFSDSIPKDISSKPKENPVDIEFTVAESVEQQSEEELVIWLYFKIYLFLYIK